MSGGLTDGRILWMQKVNEDQEMPPLSKHVALAMGTQLDLAGLRGRVPMTYLMRATSHGRRQVGEAMNRLRAAGWVEVERCHAKGRATTYRAVDPALFQRSDVRPPARQTPPGVRPPAHQTPEVDVRPPAHQTPPGVRPPAHQTPLDVRPAALVLRTREGREEPDVRTYGDRLGHPQPLTAAVPTAREQAAQTAPDEAVVDQVLARFDATKLRPRTKALEVGLRDVIRQRLAVGYTAAEVLEVATSCTYEHVVNPAGVLAKRLPQERPQLEHAPAKAEKIPWCGECSEQWNRLDDDSRPCPACNPRSFARAMTR